MAELSEGVSPPSLLTPSPSGEGWGKGNVFGSQQAFYFRHSSPSQAFPLPGLYSTPVLPHEWGGVEDS